MSNSRTVMMTGVMLWAMVLVPGFPKLVLLVMGGLFMGLARLLPPPGQEAQAAGAAAGGAKGALGGRETAEGGPTSPPSRAPGPA